MTGVWGSWPRFVLQSTRKGSSVARQQGSSSEGALLLLQDLSLSAASRPLKWLESSCNASLALQLLHTAVAEQADLFSSSPEFQAVLLHRVLPSIATVASSSNNFATLVHTFRLLRTVAINVGSSCPACLGAVLPVLTDIIEAGAHIACAAPPAGSPLGQPAGNKRSKHSGSAQPPAATGTSVAPGVVRHRYGAAGARILKGAHKALGGTGEAVTADASPTAHPSTEDSIVSLVEVPAFKLCLALECAASILSKADLARSAFVQHDLAAASPAKASERSAAPVLEPLARAIGQLTVCAFASVPIQAVLVSAAEGPSIQGEMGDAALADAAAAELPQELRFGDEQHEAIMLKFGYMYGRLTPKAMQTAWAHFQRFGFLDSPEVRPPASSILHSLAGFRNAHGSLGSSSRLPAASVLRQLTDAAEDCLAEPSAAASSNMVRRRSSSSGGHEDTDDGSEGGVLGSLAGRAGAGAASFTQRMRDMVSGGTSVARPQEYTAKCSAEILALNTLSAIGADGAFSLAHATVLALRCLQGVAYACDTQVASAAQRNTSKDQAQRSATATALTDKLSVQPSANPEMQAAAKAAEQSKGPQHLEQQASLHVSTAADASGTTVSPVAEMIECVWRPILVSFSATLAVSSNPLLLQSVLRASQSFAASCGSLSLVSARDAFLVGLCNSSMPQWEPTGGFDRFLKSAGGLWGRHAASRSARGAVAAALSRVYIMRGQLAEKHAVVFKTLFNMTHCLGNILGRSWLVVLDTVAQFYSFLRRLPGVSSRRSGAPTQWERLMSALRDTPTTELLDSSVFLPKGSTLPETAGLAYQASPRLVSSQAPMGLSGSQFTLSDSQSSDEQDEVADDTGILFSAMGSLFAATGGLSDASFEHVLRALMDLSLASLADEAARSSLESVHDVGTVMAGGRDAQNQSGSWLSRGQQLVARMRGQGSASADKGDNNVVSPPAVPERRELDPFGQTTPPGQGKTPVSQSTAATELASPSADVSSVQVAAVSPVAASPSNSPSRSTTSRRHLKEGRAVLPPFSLVRLVEVLMCNLPRISSWWGVVTPMLNALAQNPSAKVRQFAVSAHAHIVCAHLSASHESGSQLSQAQLLEPLAVFLCCPFAESRGLAVASMTLLVQVAGRELTVPSGQGQCVVENRVRWSDAGWTNLLYLLVRVVDSCAGHGGTVIPATLLPEADRVDTVSDVAKTALGGLFPGATSLKCSLARLSTSCEDPHASSIGKRSGASLLPAIGRLANQICDEHLSGLDAETICHVIIVLTALSKQSVDVNTALTATATLWTISDVVGRVVAAAGSSESATHVPLAHTVLSGQPMDLVWDLWRVLALALRSVVCTDARSDVAASPTVSPGLELFSPQQAIAATTSVRYDVRNAAVQTLFNSLSSHGSAMPSAVLQELLSTVCLPLAYDVTLRANWYASSEQEHAHQKTVGSVASPGLSVKGEVLGVVNGREVHARVHHSGDSLVKQWNDARVMALQGLTKVIAASFDNIVVLAWFHDVFSFVLALVERAVTGHSLLQARSSVRTTSTSSAEEAHLPAAASTTHSPSTPSWWEYLLGDGTEDSDGEHSAADAAESTTSTSTPKQSTQQRSAAHDVILEPPHVSVAAIACLQELALLVCVPAGVAVDVNTDGYAVGMRVVDGALVHTDGNSESDAAKGRSPAVAGVGRESTAGHEKHVARSVLWADVFATLNAIVDSPALVAEDSDKVAVAVVTCSQHILVAYSPANTAPTAHNAPLPDTFMLSARFSTVIQMLLAISTRRLSSRWQYSNPGCRADEEFIPEDLVPPRVEVALGSERAVVKALDRVAHALHSHCSAVWEEGASVQLPSQLLLVCRDSHNSETAHVVRQAIASAGADYLSSLMALATLRETQVFAPLQRMGAVAVFPGALQFAALSQLLNVIKSPNTPLIPRHVREAMSVPMLRILTSASSWYQAMVQQLQHHLKASEAAETDQQPPSLSDIIGGMGKTLDDFNMVLGADGSAAPKRMLFPLQVWGVGAGGSYSTAEAIISDSRRATRMLSKTTTHDRIISDCLVAFAEWAVSGPVVDTDVDADCHAAASRLEQHSLAWCPTAIEHSQVQGTRGNTGAGGAHSAAASSAASGAPALETNRPSTVSSLQSLQSMMGVPDARDHKVAIHSLLSDASTDFHILPSGSGADMSSISTGDTACLLQGKLLEHSADTTIGMVSSAVSAALKSSTHEANAAWGLVYVLAAGSMTPLGVLSGMPVSVAQLDAAMACASGLARLCAYGDGDIASLCLRLSLHRCCMFVACGRYDVQAVTEVATHAVRVAQGAPCPLRVAFSLLSLLLRAGAGADQVATLSSHMAGLANS